MTSEIESSFVQLYPLLSKHLNSRLCPLELIKIFRSIRVGYDPHASVEITFPCANGSVVSFLNDSGYSNLLLNIYSMVKIEDSCRDVFMSELDESCLDVSMNILSKQASLVSVECDDLNLGFKVRLPEFLCDFTLPAMNQFHSEVDLTVSEFQKWLKVVDGRKESLFLNAKAASALSQFIQQWVSSNMGISNNGPDSNMVAVL